MSTSWNPKSHIRLVAENFFYVAHFGEEKNTYRVLVGKPEGKRIWHAYD
jgi:hypothetical protein